MQAAYETFGCNNGNVFFMGIDKGNTNEAVHVFDSIYGVHYPGVSGNEGNGNAVHWQYNIQATPSVIVIMPDRSIPVKQIYPPNTDNVVDSVEMVGGIPQNCLTVLNEATIESSLKIGPNPASGEVFTVISLGSSDVIQAEILDLSGKKIRVKPPAKLSAGKHLLQIDVNDIPGGVYILKVSGAKYPAKSEKLIIRR